MIQFNDVTNKNGLVQLAERNLKMEGKISGSTDLLKNFAADINIGKQELLRTIFRSSGKWQFDDSNHEDYPIITTNLVANQRDYSFISDEEGNIILDIYKVMVKDIDSGFYYEIKPVDQQSDEEMQSFYSGEDKVGKPSRYDKTANGIFLDCIPEDNQVGGLKIFINRDGTYYIYTDTTKTTGVDGLCDEFLALQYSYRYAMRNTLDNREEFKRDLETLKKEIGKRYRDRGRDESPFVSSESINSI
jgi:hypothetical protein